MRGISELLAIIVIVAMLIGVGIAVSTFLGHFVYKQVPRGGELIIIQCQVDSYGPEPSIKDFSPQHRVEVLIRGYYEGASTIEIKRVYTNYTYFGGKNYLYGYEQATVDFELLGQRIVDPNNYVKIYGTANAPKPPKRIPIVIEYCFVDTDECAETVIDAEANYHYTS